MPDALTIVAAELSHETNTFSVVPTDRAAFERAGLRRGNEIPAALRNTATSFAGFIDGADANGVILLPALAVWATPSGMVDDEVLSELVDSIVEAIACSRPHGIALALHGAMVTRANEDADGWILERVREAVGDSIPIVATLDLHANISPRMVELADILVGYDTYPHIDQRERAREAFDLLMRLCRGEIRPVSYLLKPPMMPTSQNMPTDRDPMRHIIVRANELEERRGVLNITVAGGFPPADTEDTGFSVLVTTDGDARLAREIAEDVAGAAWERRGQFLGGVTPWEEAAEILQSTADGPIVLVDIADNPWTGGPGDSAELVRFLLNQGIGNACVGSVRDPDAVQRCMAAGPGATIDLEIGGHTDHLHGAPLAITAEVRSLSTGRYVNAGPMHAGVEVNLGPTAVVRTNGIDILLTTYAETPIDLNVFRSQGIDPTERRVIALKGKGHFRAAYEPIAAHVILVEGPGITGSDLSRLTFRRVRRPIWPLDPDVQWSAAKAQGWQYD